MTKKIFGLRSVITGGAVILATGLGTAGVASAATTHNTSTSTSHLSVRTSTPTGVAPGNPADLTHGPGETLLTGTDLTSAVAAATAAVPNATVVRAETDSAGSPYEVHMLKADGSYVTVKLNASFTVTSIEKGFGTPPAGQHPVGDLPAGTLPSGAPNAKGGPMGPPPSGATGPSA
jgi:hypothetical protein